MSEPTGKREFHWPSVLWSIHLYILGTYSLYLLLVVPSWLTFFFTIFLTTMGYLGLTIGAHRLWAHQSFEASGFLKFVLMISHTLAGVGPIYDWVLAHRIHHKYYGTDKDPFNHNKGFLYSHLITNLMKLPENYEKTAKSIDMRDIENDRFVWIQKKFYWIFFIIFGLLLPINAPAEYWGETISNSVLIVGFFRLSLLMNVSWLITSATHIWGLKPKDKLLSFIDTYSILLKLFVYKPRSHGTVTINNQGVCSQ